MTRQRAAGRADPDRRHGRRVDDALVAVGAEQLTPHGPVGVVRRVQVQVEGLGVFGDGVEHRRISGHAAFVAVRLDVQVDDRLAVLARATPVDVGHARLVDAVVAEPVAEPAVGHVDEDVGRAEGVGGAGAGHFLVTRQVGPQRLTLGAVLPVAGVGAVVVALGAVGTVVAAIVVPAGAGVAVAVVTAVGVPVVVAVIAVV